MSKSALTFRRPTSTTSSKLAAQVAKHIADIPAAIVEEVQAVLGQSADTMVHEMQAIAPVAHEFEKTAGELRDSIHKGPGRHDLAVQVIIDATDKDGHYYAAHVEFGHKTKGGEHVPPKPFVYPTIHRLSPELTRNVRLAMSRAIRRAVKGGANPYASWKFGSDE